MIEPNGEWSKWSKWVVSALKEVIDGVSDVKDDVQGLRADVSSRLVALEERCSIARMDALTTGVQSNKLSLAKISVASMLGGGVVAALLKIAEAVVAAGGPP